MAHSFANSPGKQSNDVFRDSLLRYVAFTSDFGEALKPFISRRIYLGSYAVVALYGLADTVDKGMRAYNRAASTSAQQHAPLTPLAATAATPAATPESATPAITALPTAFAPELPIPTSPSSLHYSPFNAAATACATCLPPSAVYHASSIREQRSVAVPVAGAVLDTALWHSAASLVIPAVAINRTVWATGQLLSRATWAAALPPRLRQLTPCAAGLALIPLLVPRIDEAVTEWMDHHVRPLLSQEASAFAASSKGPAAEHYFDEPGATVPACSSRSTTMLTLPRPCSSTELRFTESRVRQL